MFHGEIFYLVRKNKIASSLCPVAALKRPQTYKKIFKKMLTITWCCKVKKKQKKIPESVHPKNNDGPSSSLDVEVCFNMLSICLHEIRIDLERYSVME